MIRVALVDGHQIVRLAIKRLLKEVHDVIVVGEATDGPSALALASQVKPDILLIDLMLPEIAPLDFLHTLGKQSPKTKLIVLSDLKPAALVCRLLDSNVLCYLTKTVTFDVFETAIKKVSKGERYVDFDVVQSLASERISGKLDSGLERLSAREFQVMDLLIRGLRPSDIAAHLDKSVKTIHAQRNAVHRKLAVDNDVALLLFASKNGLLRITEPV